MRKKGYYRSYRNIFRDKTLTPTEKIVITILIHYWEDRDTKVYPKYILKGKEKLAMESGTERHTIKRVLDSLISKGLITILNYDSILDKNRSLPQIVVNENNINTYFQDDVSEDISETRTQEVEPKQVNVLNTNYINNICKRVKENGN